MNVGVGGNLNEFKGNSSYMKEGMVTNVMLGVYVCGDLFIFLLKSYLFILFIIAFFIFIL
jgi:hypothetical protein